MKYQYLLIQDDYNVWHHHDETSYFGKPLIVGRGTARQVFFDDHCKPNEDCIIDVRDVESKQEVPFLGHFEKYTFEADPIEIVLNENYFVECINSAL